MLRADLEHSPISAFDLNLPFLKTKMENHIGMNSQPAQDNKKKCDTKKASLDLELWHPCTLVHFINHINFIINITVDSVMIFHLPCHLSKDVYES